MRRERKRHQSDTAIFYSPVSDLFLLLSHRTSWLILYSLRRKGRTLEEISRSLKIAQKAVLAELKALQNSHMLISASRSTEVIYSLADKRILPALELIHKVSQRKFQHATINNNVSSTSAHSGGRQA